MEAALILLGLSLQCSLTLGFNVDDENPKIFSSREAAPDSGKSYFGYSAVLYSSGNDSILLVGAPRANSSFCPGAFEPGAVYRCSLAGNSCEEWLGDFGACRRIRGLSAYEEQDGDRGWLGASMAFHRNDLEEARVVICAPRWKKASTRPQRRSYMNGMCFSRGVEEATSTRRYYPVSRRSQTVEIEGKSYYDHGMAEAGFSLHWPTDSRLMQFAIGAPGAATFAGSSLLLVGESPDNVLSFDSFDALVPDILNDGRFQWNDYFGYSITSGQFHRPGELEYAAGAPRSSSTRGKVFIYQFPDRSNKLLRLKETLEGEQYGEYFGSALAACDVNSDGRDDLMVGAPFWSKISDEGRVYAYVSSSNEESSGKKFEIERLRGEPDAPGARFGSVISCLGDLDHDGYADVAVAAPYEEEERGAVYIFQGRPEGLSPRHSQRIRASRLGRNLRGFGQAVYHDAEANLMAVGAYLSGHAVLLSSRPALLLRTRLRIADDGFKLWINQTLIPLEFCASYAGLDDRAPPALHATFTVQVDKFHHRCIIYSKVAYGDTYKLVGTLTKGRERCTSIKTYIKKNLQNVIDPIEIKAEVNLTDSSCPNCPVVHPELSKTVAELKLAFLLDCGEDAVCHSDLHVSIPTSVELPLEPSGHRRFVIGSKSSVGLTLEIGNSGEPAYRAQARVYVPQPISLARIPPECDELAQLVNGTMEVVCNVGNPLRYNYTLFLELDMSKVVSYTNASHEILVNLTTQSEEMNFFDNTETLFISYDVDAELSIAGKSYNDSYAFFDQDLTKKNRSNSYTFDHVYEIQKFGATPIEEAQITLNVPTHWKSSKIARIRHTQGFMKGQKVKCEKIAVAENSDVAALSFSRSLVVSSDVQSFHCADKNVVCQTFFCRLGPFVKANSMARLTVTIDLKLSNNDTDGDIKAKDIFVFVSEAFVKITYPNVTYDIGNKKSDFTKISTIFYHQRANVLPLWIILLSVLLGIALTILLTALLMKLGFFKRKIKDDLDAIKSTEEVNHETVSNKEIDVRTETDVIS